MKKLGLFALLLCCFRALQASPAFIQDELAPWSLDSNVTYNDVATLRTGAISDEGTTSVTLTFKDVSSVQYYIRTSTEQGCDLLTVSYDGNTESYSGPNEWRGYWDFGMEGEHTVTLTYSKDSGVTSGDDCCWIWFEGVDTIDFGGNSEKDWDMSQNTPWRPDSSYGEWNYNYEVSKFIPYMGTPSGLEEGQESWLSYAVEGKESFTFKYIVSSEENSDCLIVAVDGNEVVSVSGDRWWEEYVISLPDTGRHIIKWTYRKDSNGNSGGNDNAYVWFEGIEKIMCDGYSMNMVYPWLVYDGEWNDEWGTYSLKSCEIPEGTATSFSKTITESREFTFRWKTSSEEGSDYLRYYVNGELKGELSGITDCAPRSIIA